MDAVILPEPFATYAANRVINADKPDRGHVWTDTSLRSFRPQAGEASVSQVCQQCGVMRRRDDQNKPCVGIVRVVPR